MSIYCGIDPGTATVGYAFIESDGRGNASVIDYGTVETPPGASQSTRLPMIAEDFSALLDRYRPAACGMERLFFATNRTTAISVAESRGVLCYLLAVRGIELREYAPAEVKKAIAGNGRADKAQMKNAVGFLLGIDTGPARDDAADALALAVMASIACEGAL